MGAPHRGAISLAAGVGQRRKGRKRRVEEPAQPDALALAMLADAVHAIVPVACANQGQPMAANRKALVESPRTMFEQGGGLVGDRRLEEAVMLAGLQLLTFNERHHLAENGGISGRLDIVRGCIGKPCTIVRNSRAYALAGMR